MSRDEKRSEEAIDWCIRLRDPAFARWEDFTVWLEDGANADAYSSVSVADAEVAESLELRPQRAVATNDNAAKERTHRRPVLVRTAGIAAALLLGLATYTFVFPHHSPYQIETAAAEHRRVMLADGTWVDLNGGSLLIADRSAPRAARLQRGEALFTVRHDADDPFVVTAGSTTLQDVGTVFNVTRGVSGTEVEVAQGAVLFNPAADHITLRAGQTLRAVDDGSNAQLGTVDAPAVGSWREGRLVYRNASISRIASDLERNIGEPVSVSPELGNNTFSGVIILDRDRKVVFERLAGLLGVKASHDGSGWRLTTSASLH